MGDSLRGVNIAGAEVAYDPHVDPVEGVHYVWPSLGDIDYLVSKGVEFVRITFSWELAQPALDSDLTDGGYFGVLRDRVTYATARGITVMVEPHGGTYANFVRYKGNPVGSAQVTAASFADLWARIEAAFADNDDVVFGLSNEPNDISTVQWFTAAAAAVDAIRDASADRRILVSGNGFGQPASWTENWYDSATPQVSNADAWALHLAGKNVTASVHTYFDADGGGIGDDVVNPDIMRERLEPVVAWARANNQKVHLTEFGASAANPVSRQAVANALAYIDTNPDVITGWSWWTYGASSFWGDYRFTLNPTENYTVDDPKMAWLQQHFAAPVVIAPVRLSPTVAIAPHDRVVTFKKQIHPGTYPDVGEGSYSMRARTRTTSSDDETFCVAILLENPNKRFEVDWHDMTIDLRQHKILDWWDADLSGISGWVTAKPSDLIRTVQPQNKISFGLCLQRDQTTPFSGNDQIAVKGLRW
jgi:endoglucanase